MSLLIEIQNLAVDGSQPMATVLRKCAVLASRLDNADFRSWVANELNGYRTEIKDVPQYRVLNARAVGNVTGLLGGGFTGITIPPFLLPEEHRDYAQIVRLRQSISELEALVQHSDETKGELKSWWPGNLVALMQDKLYDGMALYAAWQVVSRASLVGVVDTVRNRVLEFSLELQRQAPNAGEEKSASVSATKVEYLYQTIIHGNVTGNIAAGSPGAIQTTTVSKGDVKALVAALKALGVPKTETDSIVSILKKEGDQPGIGAKTAGWISGISTKVAKGSLKLAEGATAAAIIKVVMTFVSAHLKPRKSGLSSTSFLV